MNFDAAIVQYCLFLVIGRFAFCLSCDNRFYLSSLVSVVLDISFGRDTMAAGFGGGFWAINAYGC